MSHSIVLQPIHLGTGAEGGKRKFALERLAAREGHFWGGQPSIGRWLVAIADAEIETRGEPMFELARENVALMQSTQSLVEGRPDCWDHVAWFATYEEAVEALKNAKTGRHVVRDEEGNKLLWTGDIM